MMPRPAYQLFMLVLSVVALAAIGIQNAVRLDPEVELLLGYFDNVLCVAFLIDFLLTLSRSPNRMRYFFTWGWLDLLSAIPTLEYARWGRLARIARIARVLRAFRATRLLTAAVFRQRTQSTMLAAVMLAFLLLVAGSTAILQFETGEKANIIGAEDALWWAFTTITTVGYGDRFPVTTAGRCIAVILMTAGVGLFGVISATLAAWFIEPAEERNDADINALRQEIALLREAIERSKIEPSK